MDRLQDEDRRARSLTALLQESKVGWDVLESGCRCCTASPATSTAGD
jgi:hypothetical protein